MAEQFELTLESSAAVIRGCCGGDHEVGECPLEQDQQDEKKDAQEAE